MGPRHENDGTFGEGVLVSWQGAIRVRLKYPSACASVPLLLNCCMQNCEAEMAFGQYDRGLRKLISDSFHEWMVKLVQSDNRFRSWGQYFDQMGSRHLCGDTLFGQIKMAYIKYLSPRSGEVEAVEITLGHDADWKPVLAVAGSNGESVVIPCKMSLVEDVKAIMEQVLLCFDRNDLDLR
jgi:hypothetical protein